MTAHEVLVAAKGVLLNHGWCQFNVGSLNGGVCLMGALNTASWGRPTIGPGLVAGTHRLLRDDAYAALRRTIDSEVATWNDGCGRTFDEVIAAFDKAILATAPAQAKTLEPVPA